MKDTDINRAQKCSFSRDVPRPVLYLIVPTYKFRMLGPIFTLSDIIYSLLVYSGSFIRNDVICPNLFATLCGSLEGIFLMCYM
jgi:hypothetical protein